MILKPCLHEDQLLNCTEIVSAEEKCSTPVSSNAQTRFRDFIEELSNMNDHNEENESIQLLDRALHIVSDISVDRSKSPGAISKSADFEDELINQSNQQSISMKENELFSANMLDSRIEKFSEIKGLLARIRNNLESSRRRSDVFKRNILTYQQNKTLGSMNSMNFSGDIMSLTPATPRVFSATPVMSSPVPTVCTRSLRSRGPVRELPHVQPRILEWKMRNTTSGNC